jgi:hypothetical protein
MSKPTAYTLIDPWHNGGATIEIAGRRLRVHRTPAAGPAKYTMLMKIEEGEFIFEGRTFDAAIAKAAKFIGADARKGARQPKIGDVCTLRVRVHQGPNVDGLFWVLALDDDDKPHLFPVASSPVAVEPAWLHPEKP